MRRTVHVHVYMYYYYYRIPVLYLLRILLVLLPELPSNITYLCIGAPTRVGVAYQLCDVGIINNRYMYM